MLHPRSLSPEENSSDSPPLYALTLLMLLSARALARAKEKEKELALAASIRQLRGREKTIDARRRRQLE